MSEREFLAWLIAFAKVIKALPENLSVPCPRCSQGNIRYQYVGNPETRVGFVLAWCDVCNHGITVSRAQAPDGVPMIPFDEAEVSLPVPEFTRIDR